MSNYSLFTSESVSEDQVDKLTDVFVFDEAVNTLNNDTEHAGIESIAGPGDDLTVISVTHRLTTLKCCRNIAELEDVRIKRSGSYQHIIEH